MKIDVSNRAQLEAQRTKLKAALEVIEFALSKLPEDAEPASAARGGELDGLFEDELTGEIVSTALQIQESISSMGPLFKSSDVYNNIPHIQRSAIKDVFRKHVEAGELHIIEQGEGRRPTIYKKTGKMLI